jgi:RND family efflux transporter MFP subunit
MLPMKTFFINKLILLAVTVSFFAQAKPLSVEVIHAKQEVKNIEIELSGNVEALNDAQLTSLEAGVVKSVKVDAGDQVVAGQTLIELDNSLAKILLTQNQATYQSAQVRYQEDLRLYNEIVGLAKQQVIAKTLLAERKSKVAISKALLAQASAKVKLQQEIVKRHILVAPFAGVIANRNIDIGEWVSQQSKVLQLVSDDSLRILVDIPQEYFNDIKSSTPIKVKVIPDTSPQDVLNLSLSKFTAISSPVSRTFQGRIDLPKNTALVSGMSAKVKVSLHSQQVTFVTLPKVALKRHPDGSYSVYSVINNKVKRLAVELVQSSFEQVIVLGVPENTAIITSGVELLLDGMAVTIQAKQGEN